MAIIHLGFAKGKDQEGKHQCDRFVGMVRERYGNGEHPTFPIGVYLSYDHQGEHTTGLIVQYAPEVAGASETAQKIAAGAEDMWKEIYGPVKPHEKILKRVKTDEAKSR